ncbi:alpha/beta fold hydrolase [Actinomyces bowdenii]|uniref:Lysophospholipase n=1 Tax=Actinomyces bowdenii TaxID=131109 RepID=A0A853ELJ6_9ACTO|nr:alpha/beta fold hydrolase [Actinomyces bowdenii]MBF0698030.1 alpha/beta hydrolase [Actinomyces bowdenii]NYS70203.1 lysophospholipase [Actinomyces bowdenii]
MHTQITHMTAADGARLAIHSWLPDGVAPLHLEDPGPETESPIPSPAQPRAVIQVVHGMAEHAARYGRFAAAAVEAGYAVVADDHRGHGESIARPGDRSHLAQRDGWELVVADLSMLLDRIQAAYPGAPVILMGHSWGSLLARDLAARRGEELAGLIVLGTGAGAGTLTAAGMALASAESRMRGRSRPSRLLHALAFGPYRRHFAPNRTEVDWLSRDPAEVDRYVADPLCGFVTTSGFFLDLLAGMAAVSASEHARAMPPGLPMLLASGDHDPVGGMGAGVRRVATMYRHAGVREVALTLYPGARHELLNETNRGQVTADLLAWIAAHV